PLPIFRIRCAARRVASAAGPTAPTRTALSPNAILPGLWCGARTAHGAVVLAVAVDPVWHLLVDRHVIHLPDGQRDVAERAAVVPCDAGAAIARHTPVVGVARVHPDVVTVAAPAAGDREGLPAVGRAMEARVRDQHFILVLRVHLDADVVPGAADERAVPAHDVPGRAAVVRSPERPLVRGLDQRVHALRVRGRDGDVDLA